MATCIYCRRSQRERFPREHVIPRSLGSFQRNPTLGCVCGDCNHYFSAELELYLARESAESIARFEFGLRRDVGAKPNSTVTARINVAGPIFGARVVLSPSTAKHGFEITYLPQVAIQNKESEEWKWYLPEDLKAKVVQSLGPGAGVKYLVTSQTELEQLRSRLQEFGLPATKVVRHDRFLPGAELKARVTYQFYSNLARCVAKIGFNYLAYLMGEETGVLLRGDFDAVRNYVRYEQNPGTDFIYFSAQARLNADDRRGAPLEGHVLAIGWDTSCEQITCGVNLFDAMDYRVNLCRKYSGVWFPLSAAHFFDCRKKTVKRMSLKLWTPSI